MKKALMIAPMASVHRRFNKSNIAALQNLGYEVHLAANFDNGEGSEQLNAPYRKECEEKGLVPHAIPFVRAVGKKNVTLVKELVNVIRSEDFDIVHAHTETGGLLLRMAMLSLKKDFKAIYTPHGMSFYKGSGIKSQLIYRPIEKWICSKMDKNLAMNAEEMEVLNRWNKKTAAFVHGIGVDLTRFDNADSRLREELALSESTVVITAVGELNDNKNHAVVINSLSKLKDLDFCFVICGVGELEEKLTLAAKDAGVADKCKLLGYRKDIPNVLGGSDIFVFPSFHEGLPVSVMEAMASALPVVASKIRGNVDLIKEGDGGFLCAPDNTDTFAQALEVLIKDATLRKAMGEKNKQNAALYSLESVEKELVEIYE